MRWWRMPERSSRLRKSASVYSETTTRSGASATSRSMSAFWKRNTDGGTRPTMFDVPALVRPARHRDEPLRRQDLDEHLVRGQVERGDAPRPAWPPRRPRDAACARASHDRGNDGERGRRRLTRARRCRQQVREHEAVALHDLAPPHRHRVPEHRVRPRRRCGTRRSRRRGRRRRAGRRSSARVERAAGEGRGRARAGRRRSSARCRPPASISSASSAVGRPHSGNSGREARAAPSAPRGSAGSSSRKRSPKATPRRPRVACRARAPRHGRLVDLVRARDGMRHDVAAAGPTASACASSSVRRTACMATRSWAALTVVSRPDHLHVRRRRAGRGGSSALSLPLLQASSTFTAGASPSSAADGSAGRRAPSGPGRDSRAPPGTRGRAGSPPPRTPRAAAERDAGARVEARVAGVLGQAEAGEVAVRAPAHEDERRAEADAVVPGPRREAAWCRGRRSRGWPAALTVEVAAAHQDLAVEQV